MTTANFLHSYTAELAARTPLKDLTEEDKKLYLPELERRLEERIGLELIPQLDQDHLAQLTDYLGKKDVPPEQWKAFWESAIPNFSEVIRNILKKCAVEVHDILAV